MPFIVEAIILIVCFLGIAYYISLFGPNSENEVARRARLEALRRSRRARFLRCTRTPEQVEQIMNGTYVPRPVGNPDDSDKPVVHLYYDDKDVLANYIIDDSEDLDR